MNPPGDSGPTLAGAAGSAIHWDGIGLNANRKCPDCGCRVPQYDKEIEAARMEVEAWRDVAARLYAAMGLSRRERRRVYAENAYHKLKYRRPGCRPCPECGQPVLPDGQMRPHADWYRHARGCSRDDWSPNAAGSATEGRQ